jgi:putative Ca2+/H+ antiporter (TMEM165/GDT1 family)
MNKKEKLPVLKWMLWAYAGYTAVVIAGAIAGLLSCNNEVNCMAEVAANGMRVTLAGAALFMFCGLALPMIFGAIHK